MQDAGNRDHALDPVPGGGGITTAHKRVSYADPRRRAVAYLLDETLAVSTIMLSTWLILRSLMGLGIWGPHLQVVAPAGTGQVGFDVASMWNTMEFAPKLLVFLAFLISCGPLYFIVMESSPWQATLGKRLFRVYVTDNEQRPISPGTAAWRWIVKACFPGLFVVLPLVVMEVSERRKSVHDFAARTVVLSGRAEGKIEPWRLIAAFGGSTAWVVATFMVLL
jgi:uncharacterized RDD family membrane protein YckC